jgi:motility quorum-sensing regulator/GCU-specific mRNA interferase toxin
MAYSPYSDRGLRVPTWLPRILRRIRELAAAGRVRFTFKAVRELAALSLDADDAVDILRSLSSAHTHGRLRSEATDEWMYVFKPIVGETVVYVKVAVRDDCIVVSFHEDEADHDDSA